MKTSHQILTELESSGDLKRLVMDGHISVCTPTRMEVYRYVDARVKTGTKKTSAVLEAQVQFNMCRTMIFRIIKSLT